MDIPGGKSGEFDRVFLKSWLRETSVYQDFVYGNSNVLLSLPDCLLSFYLGDLYHVYSALVALWIQYPRKLDRNVSFISKCIFIYISIYVLCVYIFIFDT